MTAPPSRRPGGRSERVRQAVLAAADDLAGRGEDVTVAALASRAGVSEVTIYRRWRTADNVLLDAAVHVLSQRLPLTPTGNLQQDLTSWALNVEHSLATPWGRLLLATVVRIRLAYADGAEATSVRPYLDRRRAQIQALIDAAHDPAPVTVSDVLDGILAPIYLRHLFGYQPGSSTEQLVRDLLSRGRRPA